MDSRITRFGMALGGAALALALAAVPARADDMPAAPAIGGSAADVVMEALALLGIPYRYGGDDPARGLDCSGLVRHVFRSVHGIDLPRSSEEIAQVGAGVARHALELGDVVFFDTRGRRFSHVGIYIGDGRFVHAPARRGQVRVETMEVHYWRARFNGARRLVIDAGAPGLSARSVAGAPAPARPECASCGR